MGVMDERPPVQIPGQPQTLNPLQALAAAIAQMSKNPMANRGMPQLPQGGGTPGQVGGAPPNMGGGPIGGSPGGPLPTNPAAYTGQAKGPSAYPVSPHPAFATGFEFRTRAGRNAAVVAGTMQGISDAVQRQKQQTWDKKKQEAEQAAAGVIFKRQQAMEAQQRGDQSAAQQFQKEADDLMKDKKVSKIFQKGTEDYNSPEYLGIQGAYQASMKKIAGEQAMADAQQARALQAAQAKKAEADAFYTGPEGLKLSHKYKMEELEAMRKVTIRGPYQDPKDKKWYNYIYSLDGQPMGRTETGVPAQALPQTTQTQQRTTDPFGGTTEKEEVKVTYKGFPVGGIAPLPKLGPKAPKSMAKDEMLDRAAWTWWATGNAPPAGKSGLRDATYNRMMEIGLTPGQKPSAQAISRASAANAVLVPDQEDQMGLIDRTIAQLRASKGEDLKGASPELAKVLREEAAKNPDATMDTFSDRWYAAAQRAMGTIPPNLNRISANLTSIYSFAGTFHGWRALRVAEEFSKAYGGLTTDPDATIAALEEMKKTAESIRSSASSSQGLTIPGTSAPDWIRKMGGAGTPSSGAGAGASGGSAGAMKITSPSGVTITIPK